MAIAFDDVSARQADVGVTTLTFAKTCTGSDLALAVGIDTDADTVTGVTYNGVAMIQLGKVAVAGGRFAYFYYLLSPATGSNNIVITSSVPTTIIAYAASYTGVKQSGQPDASTINTDTAVQTLTTTLTTVADNCWTIIFARNNGAGMTGGAGTMVRGNTVNSEQLADSNGAITPAGSTSLILNWTGVFNIAAIMASFAPAVGNFLIMF